jgi:dihydrofolate reductase
MGKTVLDITMSLDGFIAGPGITTEEPMGRDGQKLHDWIFVQPSPEDRQVISELLENAGSVILGGRTYLVAIGSVWEHVSPFLFPAFVLCHDLPLEPAEGFTFVTEGIGAALEMARTAALGKNVWVMGGAYTARQFLVAGILDELHLHIAPVMLCRGIRLFDFLGRNQIELKKLKAIDTPGATHLFYQVINRDDPSS